MSFTRCLWRSVRLTLALWLITVVIITLPILGFANLLFHDSATGSLIYRNDVAIGSRLVGQSFRSSRYLQGRAMSPSGLSVANPKLQQRVAAAVEAWQRRGVVKPAPDLLLDSASNVDPHISLAAAEQQLPLLAKERNLALVELEAMLQQNLEKPITLSAVNPVVNVLAFNLALDRLETRSAQGSRK